MDLYIGRPVPSTSELYLYCPSVDAKLLTFSLVTLFFLRLVNQLMILFNYVEFDYLIAAWFC